MHRRGFLRAAVACGLAVAIGSVAPRASLSPAFHSTGLVKGCQAWRKNVDGVVKAPFPATWDVTQT
jgi:hypothetical protein